MNIELTSEDYIFGDNGNWKTRSRKGCKLFLQLGEKQGFSLLGRYKLLLQSYMYSPKSMYASLTNKFEVLDIITGNPTKEL